MLLLLVGLGGFLGTITRYGAYLALKPSPDTFPWATLVVNIVGCFLIGVVYFWSQKQSGSPALWLPVLTTGFLGGLTTFSAFGLESFLLIQNHHYALAAANITASILLGIGALFVAHLLF